MTRQKVEIAFHSFIDPARKYYESRHSGLDLEFSQPIVACLNVTDIDLLPIWRLCCLLTELIA
jgi:hypothetical protein